MEMITDNTDTIDAPVAVPVIKKEEKPVAKTLKEEEGQVIVHCTYRSGFSADGIRIWKTTYLFDKHSHHKSKLIHAHNITISPEWTWLQPNTTHRFTLYFKPLPKGCKSFDLVEKIALQNAFAVSNIERNETDVYEVEIF